MVFVPNEALARALMSIQVITDILCQTAKSDGIYHSYLSYVVSRS